MIFIGALSHFYGFCLLQRKTFIRFAKVFPLVSVTGWKPSPHLYRRVIGVTEVTCGLLLSLVPGTN